jgi:hypothetical protein
VSGTILNAQARAGAICLLQGLGFMVTERSKKWLLDTQEETTITQSAI